MSAQSDVVEQGAAFLDEFKQLADKVCPPRDYTGEVLLVKELLERAGLTLSARTGRHFSNKAAEALRRPPSTVLSLGEFYILKPLDRRRGAAVVPVAFAVAENLQRDNPRCVAQVVLFLFTVANQQVTRVLGLRFEGGDGHHDFPHCQITINLGSDSPECFLHGTLDGPCRTVLCEPGGLSPLLSVPSIPVGFGSDSDAIVPLSAQAQAACLPRAARIAVYGTLA